MHNAGAEFTYKPFLGKSGGEREHKHQDCKRYSGGDKSKERREAASYGESMAGQTGQDGSGSAEAGNQIAEPKNGKSQDGVFLVQLCLVFEQRLDQIFNPVKRNWD